MLDEKRQLTVKFAYHKSGLTNTFEALISAGKTCAEKK